MPTRHEVKHSRANLYMEDMHSHVQHALAHVAYAYVPGRCS